MKVFKLLGCAPSTMSKAGLSLSMVDQTEHLVIFVLGPINEDVVARLCTAADCADNWEVLRKEGTCISTFKLPRAIKRLA